MPRFASWVPLLRPLAAPRAIAYRPHLHFSTAARLQAEQPPAKANPTTTPSLPPNASSEHPSTPQEAQRAADLAAAESLTESDSAQPAPQKPILPSKHPRADNKPSTSSSPAKPTPADALTPTPPAANKPNTTASLQQQKKPKPKAPRTARPVTLSLPPPKYHVSRSASKNLPIYTDYKRGGNLHLTTVRRITGDLSALRDELRVFLNKKNEDVTISSLTGHVVVKGRHTGDISAFLRARGM
ncbi:hypothetical protein BDW02DRAFT_542939 [Decorospora gaudefroyi]|uniref:Large ribosomal subunit protein mL49 n=1 Tax=Decorospora gaudefroyi TaxID=184978 RepID=A0A6A5KU44_9PLEO|nr:hypothetical protein BDW02DRAFT_542939 [Decorospora gaudefroyi]